MRQKTQQTRTKQTETTTNNSPAVETEMASLSAPPFTVAFPFVFTVAERTDTAGYAKQMHHEVGLLQV